MSVICNGVNKQFDESVKFAEENDKRSKFDTYEDNRALQDGFRGFNKIPQVQLARIDITPYLTKLNESPPLFSIPNVKTKYSRINRIHLDRVLQKCSVKLVRSDINRLDKALNSGYSTETTLSDSETSMVNMKCKICDKEYSSEKKLQNHQENKHMIVYEPQNKTKKRVSFSDHVIIHEVKEYHKCRKCTKIFEDYKTLKMHMKQKHKKRKCYVCNYCSKKFVDCMFFKVHIKLHCDVCGQLLPNKKMYMEHRRNICRILKMYKCKSCDESYFKFMDLKDHSYEHVGTYFICDICKDQFQTKCGVSHHISCLHSKKRPMELYTMHNLGTERLYLCNFCEESSVERDVIENHTSILPDLSNKAMTGYKDYYFCDQCLKKFDVEMDMLQHKWTHFLKNTDHSQTRPNGMLLKEKLEIKKTTFKASEKIPDYMQPKLVLEKIKVDGRVLKDPLKVVIDINNFDILNGDIKKPIVDQKSKKTLLSKYQCENCGKYYSSSYCLRRHKQTQHGDFEHLRCNVCEETFVWLSLLKTHKCIRMQIPEMPFDDARPEIHFDNLHEMTRNEFDDFNITDDDDGYMNSVDFEIPAPIVELTEYENQIIIPCDNVDNGHLNETVNNSKDIVTPLDLGYKLVLQEVPIEF